MVKITKDGIVYVPYSITINGQELFVYLMESEAEEDIDAWQEGKMKLLAYTRDNLGSLEDHNPPIMFGSGLGPLSIVQNCEEG